MDYNVTMDFTKHSDVRETIASSSYQLGQLSDAELLAAFLKTGVKGDTVQQAESILSEFPLSRFHMIDSQILAKNGVSKAKIASMMALVELTKRSMTAKDSNIYVQSSYQLSKMLCNTYGHREQEHLVALYLTSQNEIIEERVISIGSNTNSTADPKDIIRQALRLNAISVIVCHNHPSGSTNPSRNDNAFTERLKECCDLFDIVLLDHFVVAKDSYFSYREQTVIL